MAAALPPYGSTWISTALSWAKIEELANAGEHGNPGLQSIVDSCMPETARTDAPPKSYGDFGRYVVGHAVWHFWPDSRDDQVTAAEPFALDFAHRYIITRVLDLGWSADLFGPFDTSVQPRSRFDNPVERIGKKYQWIALSEFLARATDSFPVCADDDTDLSRPYQFPHDVYQTMITDTSLIRADTTIHGEPSDDTPVLPEPRSLWREASDDQWLLSKDDFPDPMSYLSTGARAGMSQGLLLAGRFEHTQNDRPGRTEGNRRYRAVRLSISSYAIRPDDLVALTQWIRTTKANDGPGLPDYGNSLFGELYWSRQSRADSEARNDTPGEDGRGARVLLDQGFASMPVPMIPLGAHYQRTDECSDATLYAGIPSRWLATALELRSGPLDFAFSDPTGAVVCWNVASSAGGLEDAAYVQAEPLRHLLKARGLMVAWWVTGEKMAVAPDSSWRDDRPILPFFQGLYWQLGGAIRGWTSALFDDDFRAGRPRQYPQPLVFTEVWQTESVETADIQTTKNRKDRALSKRPL